VRAQATQGLQLLPQGSKPGLIETADMTGKGGERYGYHLGTTLGQWSIDSFPQCLKGLQTALQEAFDQAIAREPNWRKQSNRL